MDNILITICARGGSKGVPGKNIKLISGKPLIRYTIDFANDICNEFNADIAVSTDSNEIINVVKEFGIDVPYKRPDNLSTDSAGKISAIADVLNFYEEKFNKSYDYILDLDVTSPLRTIEDVRKAFEIMKLDGEALNIFSVSEARKNPYFNMVEESNGYMRIVKEKEVFLSRQSAPVVYELNASLYIYRRSFFTAGHTSAFTERSKSLLMEHICFDIDSQDEFDYLEYLIDNDKLNFKF